MLPREQQPLADFTAETGPAGFDFITLRGSRAQRESAAEAAAETEVSQHRHVARRQWVGFQAKAQHRGERQLVRPELVAQLVIVFEAAIADVHAEVHANLAATSG